MAISKDEKLPHQMESFAIDADVVKHVAFLVRLAFRKMKPRPSATVTAINDYFHLLNEVDTCRNGTGL